MVSKSVSRINPFFYIIRHKQSGMLYAGYVKSKGKSNSDLFMTEEGYQTSSKIVKSLIANEGLDAFEIDRIRHFESGEDALLYESRFLLKVDAMNNPKFFNRSNGGTTFTTLGVSFPVSDYTRQKMSEINKGKKWWNNGKVAKYCKERPDGDEWVRGRLPDMSKLLKEMSDNGKGKVAWNNGTDCVRSKECPGEGWVLGYLLSDETRDLISKGSKGRKWWNNGIDSILAKTCPEGWVEGRLTTDEQRTLYRNHKLGKSFWHNGKETIIRQECPGEGWFRGQLKKETNKSKRLWNNGSKMMMSINSPGPEWSLGKIKSCIEEGRVWWNNGETTKLSKDQPEGKGWVKGRL